MIGAASGSRQYRILCSEVRERDPNRTDGGVVVPLGREVLSELRRNTSATSCPGAATSAARSVATRRPRRVVL